jgi:OmpA-OmpF porin, OOP family
MLGIWIPLLVLGAATSQTNVSDSLVVTDSRNNKVTFKHGLASFADEVVDYKLGTGNPVQASRRSEAILGAPDRGKRKDKLADAVTLGSGGSITVRFVDNVLVDVDGLDLYVFEVGPDVEATFVEISEDGATWLTVGRVAGSVSGLDIASVTKPGQVFRYVRITDDPKQGDSGGEYPGADVDAVGAIGSTQRIELSGNLLFDVGSDELRAAAQVKLGEVAADLKRSAPKRVLVEGHTDNTGVAAQNDDLSQRRAQSVLNRLAELGVAKEPMTARGLGSRLPVANNDTDDGRQRNRRVEIHVFE